VLVRVVVPGLAAARYADGVEGRKTNREEGEVLGGVEVKDNMFEAVGNDARVEEAEGGSKLPCLGDQVVTHVKVK
jgi:hypothetical protein